MTFLSRRTLNLAMLLLLVSALAACGGSNETPSPEKSMAANAPIEVTRAAIASAEETPSVKVLATTAKRANAAPVLATCSLETTRSFGAACFAAARGLIPDGSTRSFPNAKAGYTGSTTASCSKGVVSWSAETCKHQTTLLASALTKSTSSMSAAAAAQAAAQASTSAAYQIGTYYFGGWKDNQLGSSYAKPWDQVKLYPDREPRLGRYAEDTPGVLTQQLQWMRQYGIDFVVFNWYWGDHNQTVMDHALKAYLALPNKEGVKFAVQWSNHTDINFSKAQFDTLFRFWARNYFKSADYQRYNGKPAVYIFSAPTLLRNAKAIGMSTAQLIQLADDIAKAEGLPGISVIGGMWGGDPAQDYSASNGFAAFTMYNYHSPASIALMPLRDGNQSRSYAEFHQSYANQWDWMIKNTTLPFIVPMSPGWDSRPWGGSKDPLHDNSRGLASEFLVHLQAAKAFMDAYPTRTQRMGVICCWNEFGEGSFIEPTKVDGMAYIEQVPKVFGAR